MEQSEVAAPARACYVTVRSVDCVSEDLYRVALRTDTGDTINVVVSKRMATTETVAMTAHAVATLVKLNIIRLPT